MSSPDSFPNQSRTHSNSLNTSLPPQHLDLEGAKDTVAAVQGDREIAFCIETSLSNIEGDERSSNGDGNKEDVEYCTQFGLFLHDKLLNSDNMIAKNSRSQPVVLSQKVTILTNQQNSADATPKCTKNGTICKGL